MGKISVLLAVLLVVGVSAKDPIQITLFQKPEAAQLSDYLEIVLKIRDKDASLPSALLSIAKRRDAVQKEALAFCGEPGKKRCQESVQIGEPEIETKYQVVKKQDTFVGFEVSQEVTLKVYKTDTVGLLVDDLQKIGGIKFESFAWKGNKEIEDESAVVEGAVERAKQLCDTVNHAVDRIVSIERYVPEEEDEEKDDEEEGGGGAPEEEEEEEDVYKVQLECVEKKKGKGSTQL